MKTDEKEAAESFLLFELPKPQTKVQLQKIKRWVLEQNSRLDVLMALFVSGNYRITQRAVRIISLVAQDQPELVQPYLPFIVSSVSAASPDAVKRNVMRLLKKLELPEKLLGQIASLCFTFLANPKEAVAIRAFSIAVLARICLLQPGLTREFLLLLDDILPFAGPGLRVQIRNAKKMLETH